jgi:sulfoxide reductase heme-binding subunit YedZ
MALWYLSRATGAATLVLLTASVALGVANAERLASRRFPRFVVDGLHRTLSLATCILLALHVATTLLDGYAPIRLVDAVLPFTGRFRPVWLGLGALALDLLVALAVTSLLRARLGLRAWRAVHWSAYACWPVALVHGLGTGSDVRAGWLMWTALACGFVVCAAVFARLADRRTPGPVRAGGVAVVLAGATALTIWLPSGPMAPGWAAKAGTPPALLRGAHATGARR